jgi:uroporphyrin-III C-methyltransferase/precorrin-2 dehydrogenase/sirohydrochlorin ferrochelatase
LGRASTSFARRRWKEVVDGREEPGHDGAEDVRVTRHVAPHETRPARLERLDRLPIFLDLAEKRAVVVGGGTGAAWKAELLAAAGARVDVYAPAPCAEMLALAAEPGEGGALRIHRRRWTAADLAGAAITVAAPDEPAEVAALAAAAKAAGVPLNVVDHPLGSDFQFGAIVNRSPVVVGISTAGGAPVLAQAVRRRIEAALPRPLGAWGRAALALRARLKTRLPDLAERRRFWDRFAAAALAADAPPDQARLDALAAEPAGGAGRVTLVGAGPGDPELLTLKAVRALQAADVIIYDRLVGAEILELGRREARRIAVGKAGHGESCRQEDINALLVELAGQGLSVVRLKGGDPMVFGRAGEEIAALGAAGIAVTVIPGITAALAAAAALGASLSHRDHARRIQFVTGHDRHGRLAPDLDYAALADPAATTAVYMGRGTAAELAKRLIAEGLAAATPVAIVTNVSSPTQRLDRTDLGCLAAGGAGDGREPVVILIGEAIGVYSSVATPTREVAAS